MWAFLDYYRNWLLALLAFAFWAGAFTWYFGRIIRTAWRERFDHWTKE